jgi:hypothetical protein
MMRTALALILVLTLSACGLFRPGGTGRQGPVTGPTVALPGAEPTAVARPVTLGASTARPEDLDLTTGAEKAAALAEPAAAGERDLGTAVVALGPPGDQGLWLSTALVQEVAQGRVVTADGTSLAVELRPGSGGALLSLAAFQALGLPLTALPELRVFGP